MKAVSYQDPEGRWWQTLLPQDAPESDAEIGIPAGPPSLEALALPLEVEVRLHNELFHRRLLTERDLRRNRQALMAAIQSAFKVDAERVWGLYRDSTPEEESSAERSISAQEQSDPGLHPRGRSRAGRRGGLPGARPGAGA